MIPIRDRREVESAENRIGRPIAEGRDKLQRLVVHDPLGASRRGHGTLPELALGAFVARLSRLTDGRFAAAGRFCWAAMRTAVVVTCRFRDRLAAAAIERGERRRNQQHRRDPGRTHQLQQTAEHFRRIHTE